MSASELNSDTLDRDRAIFERLDKILSESQLRFLCGEELSDGRMNGENRRKADELQHVLGIEEPRFSTQVISTLEDEFAARLCVVLDFTRRHFFCQGNSANLALYPEFRSMGYEKEYFEFLSDIRQKAEELWRAYFQFRETVRRVLLV
jgi:hypothetical protein